MQWAYDNGHLSSDGKALFDQWKIQGPEFALTSDLFTSNGNKILVKKYDKWVSKFNDKVKNLPKFESIYDDFNKARKSMRNNPLGDALADRMDTIENFSLDQLKYYNTHGYPEKVKKKINKWKQKEVVDPDSYMMGKFGG